MRLRGYWAEQRWLVLGVAAAVVYGVGLTAYLRQGNSLSVAMYHALQLFALNSPDEPPPSLLLTIARFAAPLITAAAAVQAAYSLFREQLQLAGVRFAMRDHVIVVGLGSVGFRLAVSFHDAGYQVVVIERDPAHGSIAGCRERQIPVLRGDATDPTVLNRTRLIYARHMIVTCGDDAANLDVTVAVSRLIPDGQVTPSLFVHLGDLALWRRLQAEVLLSAHTSGPRLEFFNVLDSAARVLLETHPPFGDDSDRPHLLFIGLDEIGPFAVLHAARRWQIARGPSDDKLQMSVLGPKAPEQVAELLARHPDLDRICAIHSERVAVDEERFQRGDVVALRDESGPTAVYVCLANESDALTAALVLRGLARTHRVPVVVTVWDEESGIASLMQGGMARLLDVTEFAVLKQTLVPDVTLLGTNELVARLRHEEYVRWERERGETELTNPSVVGWEELPQSLQDSNRAFAAGIGRKLAASGCVVVPAPLAEAGDGASLFSREEIEELARMEHDRWMNDLLRLGWQPTTGPKDPASKLHPLLVPWEALSEIDRDRDRASIRALSSMLARAGFEICRVSPPEGAGRDGETRLTALAAPGRTT